MDKFYNKIKSWTTRNNVSSVAYVCGFFYELRLSELIEFPLFTLFVNTKNAVCYSFVTYIIYGLFPEKIQMLIPIVQILSTIILLNRRFMLKDAPLIQL